MGPIVLILSYGFTKPIDIVKKLISLKACTTNVIENPKEIIINEIKFTTYDYDIKNKYFETKIQLLPYEEQINTLPKELLNSIEALIVSFNSADKSFLIHVPKLCKLSEENNIELNLLITGQLFDDCNEGLSYGDVKDACKHTFDVIETLNKEIEDDKEIDDKIDNENNIDYTEIIEALENHVWSNVASSSGGKDTKSVTKTQPTVQTHTNAAGDGNDDDDDVDEAQLEAYEALLTNIVNFKNNSANLNRDQMLDKAEKLAELFAEFMGED